MDQAGFNPTDDRTNRSDYTWCVRYSWTLCFSFLFVITFAASLPSWAQELKEVCSGIYWEGAAPFRLGTNEKSMVCGFQDSPWKKIPLSQAESFLKVFLQQRGYFFPQFKQTKFGLVIQPGDQSQVKSVEFIGTPDGFHNGRRYWQFKDQVMNSEFLDEWSQYGESRLQELGFACGRSEAKADPKTGQVLILVTPGSHHRMIGIERPRVEGLSDKLWRRFDAFKIGEAYQHQQLLLTASRIQREGVAENAYFETKCRDDGINIKENVTLGPPQFVAFGFGANTQEYPIARARWRNGRWGSSASSVESSLYMSSRRQSVDVQGQWYFLPSVPELSFSPMLTLERESEQVYESVLVRWQGLSTLTHEDSSSRWTFQFGPSQSFRWNVTGAGDPYLSYMSIEGRLSRVSHELEWNLENPVSGYEWRLSSQSQVSGMLAPVTAHHIRWAGRIFYNLGRYEPARWVLGFRSEVRMTFGQETDSVSSQLGPDFRSFLGGDRSLRGFARNGINGLNYGYFTTVMFGSEMRWVNQFWWNIEPLAFVDFGQVGFRSGDLTPGLLWSPGLGLRWMSPFGVFRLTWARGLVQGQELKTHGLDQQSQWFLSYGTEF